MSEKQILPLGITSKADVIRAKRELEDLDEHLHQLSLRKASSRAIPKISQQLDELVATTGMNLHHKADRQKLISMMGTIAKSAPTIHLSFATSPSPVILQKITHWVRTEINPTALLQVGLQPSIAAGCVVRTPNKQFDFSLRQFLQTKQKDLIQALRGSDEQ